MHIEACRLSGFCHQDNVELHQQLPQQQLLKRAAAFVTHGGLSSIKEGILAGIPMIVTPEVFDQPFNAMRAVYHRLAPAIFTDEMNARALELALNSILEHTLRSPEISYFQSIFAEASANPQAALIIENQMSGCHRL